MIWASFNHWSLEQNTKQRKEEPHFLSDAGQPHWCNEHEPGQSPGDGEGRIGLGCHSPWSHKELDMTGRMNSKKNLIARVSQVALVVKNPPANAGDLWDTGSIPGSRRSPWEGNGNQLQYSCLENAIDRGDWWATVHGVSKSRTGLKQLSTHWELELQHQSLAFRKELVPLNLSPSDSDWNYAHQPLQVSCLQMGDGGPSQPP